MGMPGHHLPTHTHPSPHQGQSKTFEPLQQHGYAVYANSTPTDSVNWPDSVCGHPCYLYDASNPAAREWWWGEVQKGYFDYGAMRVRCSSAPRLLGLVSRAHSLTRVYALQWSLGHCRPFDLLTVYAPPKSKFLDLDLSACLYIRY